MITLYITVMHEIRNTFRMQKWKVVSRTIYLNYYPVRSHRSRVDSILNPIQPVQRACVIKFIVAQPPVSPFLLSFPLAILPLQNSRSVRQLPLGITPASSQLYAQPASPPSGWGNSGYRAAELVAAG